jgi:hypothetical protein
MNAQPSITKTRNLDGVGEKMKQIYRSSVQRNRLTFPHTGPRYSLDISSIVYEYSGQQSNGGEDEKACEEIDHEIHPEQESQIETPAQTKPNQGLLQLRNRKSYISRTEMLAQQQTNFSAVKQQKVTIRRHDEELVLLSREGNCSPEAKIEVMEIGSGVQNTEEEKCTTENECLDNNQSIQS